jgi:hypothetical protein
VQTCWGWSLHFEQDDPAAIILQKGGGALFDEIFVQMKEKQVAIVIDLTAAFRGFWEERRGILADWSLHSA